MSDTTHDTDGLLRITTAPLALPPGLRDLLPPRAAQRRARARAAMDRFAQWGYELVALPAYEREESVARGLSQRARADLVRFVEPGSSHVVALRPDMTPQIARIAATRFAECQAPLRLMYEGSVIRTPRGRSRKLRQLSQAGVELIGWASLDADIEVIELACSALDALGLREVRVELSHAAIADALVGLAPEKSRAFFIDALSTRDLSTIEKLLADRAAFDRVRRIIALAGDASMLDSAEARALEADPIVAGALSQLRTARDRLCARGLQDRVLVDLGESRGLGYYTGLSFVLLARGVGEPIGAGGRYDTLLAEYGAPRPATGCALDLELVDEALGRATNAPIDTRPVLLLGASSERAIAARALRAQGVCVAEADPETPLLPLDLERFSRVLQCEGGSVIERPRPPTRA